MKQLLIVVGVIVVVFVAWIVATEISHNHGRCKGLQAEAQANLVSLFAAQQSFHQVHGFYTTDLAALRWAPKESAPHYMYGFARAAEVPDGVKVPEGHDPTRRHTVLLDPPLDPALLPEEAVVSETGWVAAAIGDIDTDLEVQLDVWTLNEQKLLQAISNDCTDETR